MVNQIEEEKREKPVGSDGMQTSLLFSAKIGSELLFKVKNEMIKIRTTFQEEEFSWTENISSN